MGQQVTLLLLLLASHVGTLAQVLAALFPTDAPGKAAGADPSVWYYATMWDTRMAFLTPGFSFPSGAKWGFEKLADGYGRHSDGK